MATKAKQSTKKSPAKMRDLSTRKDPKGGAQKKEINNPETGSLQTKRPGRNLN